MNIISVKIDIRGYLLDTCLTAQDEFKEKLDKAKIKY